MKLTFFTLIASVLIFASSTFAQSNAVPITGGNFLMERNSQSSTNARLETANFTAVSWMRSDFSSAWDVCSLTSSPTFCQSGMSFAVPSSPTVEVGFCGACSPPQFPRGAFTINGATYENVYFSGQFNFSQATFSAMPMRLAKRRGLVRYRSPFTMTANFTVCRTAPDLGCRTEDILYDGQLTGRGTLTLTARVVYDPQVSPRPFLRRETVEYNFER